MRRGGRLPAHYRNRLCGAVRPPLGRPYPPAALAPALAPAHTLTAAIV